MISGACFTVHTFYSLWHTIINNYKWIPQKKLIFLPNQILIVVAVGEQPQH